MERRAHIARMLGEEFGREMFGEDSVGRSRR